MNHHLDAQKWLMLDVGSIYHGCILMDVYVHYFDFSELYQTWPLILRWIAEYYWVPWVLLTTQKQVSNVQCM